MNDWTKPEANLGWQGMVKLEKSKLHPWWAGHCPPTHERLRPRIRSHPAYGDPDPAVPPVRTAAELSAETKRTRIPPLRACAYDRRVESRKSRRRSSLESSDWEIPIRPATSTWVSPSRRRTVESPTGGLTLHPCLLIPAEASF